MFWHVAIQYYDCWSSNTVTQTRSRKRLGVALFAMTYQYLTHLEALVVKQVNVTLLE